ncbi:MAG: hypothetical protein WCP20_21185 [Desulfuromonadales bacterium]
MIQKRVAQLTGCVVIVMTAVCSSAAEKPQIKPYPHYWMSVATSSQNIPGMTPEMAGMASMFGGGSGFGPKRDLTLQLESPQTPSAAPEAFHDIPPGQNMGKNLPLVTPKIEKQQQRTERDYPPATREKAKIRMLYYWGCGETIGTGQPRIFDSEKSGFEEMAQIFKGRAPTVQTPPSARKGWTYGEWPSTDERTAVPKDSSLIGAHTIRGNYTVNIPFTLDVKRDFMSPVEFTSVKGTASGATELAWKSIPTAIGYFATAMGSDGKGGDMIMWSASEIPENGMTLMDYLTPGDIHHYIRDKVIMDPSRTSCTVPPIFKNAQGAMVQFIAYGEQLDIVHPPKPKDPKQIWQPEWSVKVRLKSTSMTPLGINADGEERRGRSSSKKTREQSRQADRDSDEKQSVDDNADSKKSRGRGVGDGLRGLFGF